MNDTLRTMTVKYTNGNTQMFQFPQQAEAHNLGARIQEALAEGNLLIDLGDSTMVIPLSSVESLTVSPSPETLPKNAVRGAQLIKG